MAEKSNYIELNDLEVYKLSRELSSLAWDIYSQLTWQDKKIMGDQFIESTDSAGANIAEGYGRFHYLDRIKFYYNSRASYLETERHWLSLLYERKKIDKDTYDKYQMTGKNFLVKLNNFIASTYKAKYQPYNDSKS